VKKRHLRPEAGQALILVALAMPLFMSIAALVVDGTNLMVHHRQLQTAVDGAALAAAQELTPDQSITLGGALTCDGTWATEKDVQPRPKLVEVLEDYSSKNNGPATLDGGSCPSDRARCRAPTDKNCYTWPYTGNNGLIEVRLTEAVAGFFTSAVDALAPGHPVGSLFTVSAWAVASSAIGTVVTNGSSTSTVTAIPSSTSTGFTTTTTPWIAALFAKNTACGANQGIVINGNNDSINGLAFSNGNMTISDGNHVDNAYYGGPFDCSLDNPSRTSTHTKHANDQDWPKIWDRETVCAGHDVTGALPLDNPTDGVYCSDTSIHIANLRDGTKITAVAPEITVSNTINNTSVSPFFDDLLFWQTSGDFTLDSNKLNIDGWVWVPGGSSPGTDGGRLTFAGNSGAHGFFEAYDILVSGNNLTLTGNGPIGGPTTIPVTTSTTPGVSGTTITVTTSSTQTTGTTIGLDE